MHSQASLLQLQQYMTGSCSRPYVEACLPPSSTVLNMRKPSNAQAAVGPSNTLALILVARLAVRPPPSAADIALRAGNTLYSAPKAGAAVNQMQKGYPDHSP